MIRAFVGLPLPREYQELLGELRRAWNNRFRTKLGWTRQGNWHLTLKYLGECTLEEIADVKQALSMVAFRSFRIQGGGGGCFPPLEGERARPRVVWVGLKQGGPECSALARDIEQAVEPAGFEPEKRKFSPHLTLARVKTGKNMKFHGDDPWMEKIQELNGLQWPGFEADRFILWQSVLGPGGPTYTPLAEYPGQ